MCTRTILKFQGQIALFLKLIIELIQEQNIFGCHDLLPGPYFTYEGSPLTCDLLHKPADGCLKSSSVTKEAWGQSRLLEIRQELFLHCWISDSFILYIVKIFRYTIIFEIGKSCFFSRSSRVSVYVKGSSRVIIRNDLGLQLNFCNSCFVFLKLLCAFSFKTHLIFLCTGFLRFPDPIKHITHPACNALFNIRWASADVSKQWFGCQSTLQ